MSSDDSGPGRRRRGARAKWRFAILALGVFILVGFAFRRSILVASASFLDVGEPPTHADLIHLLGGAIDSRPLVAADLYRLGFAPRIFLSRVEETEASLLGVFPNETDATMEILRMKGVPDSAIVVVEIGSGASSTTDDARILARYLAKRPAERVLVVTSAYHTRRARWNLRRQLATVPVEIRMISAPDPKFSAEDWWTHEAGMLAITEEYLKFLHNWIYR